MNTPRQGCRKTAGASFWHTLGGKIVGNLGFEGDNGTDTHFEALELASDAAAAVVDTLVEACAAESADTTPTNHEVSALAALRFLRSVAKDAAFKKDNIGNARFVVKLSSPVSDMVGLPSFSACSQFTSAHVSPELLSIFIS